MDFQLRLPGGQPVPHSTQQFGRRVRIDAERPAQTDHRHAILQRFGHRFGGAEPAGDHDRRSGRRDHLAGIGHEIGFARPCAVARPGVKHRLQTLQPHHAGLFVIAAGNLDQVDAFLIEQGHHGQTVFKAEAALLKVGRIQLHTHHFVWPDSLPHCAHGLDQQAGAVLQRAAPAVIALIDARIEELADQIAVGAMNLHTVKPGIGQTARRVGEARDDVGDLVLGQTARRREDAAGQLNRHGGRPHRLWRNDFRALAPGMGDLRDGCAAA